MPTPVESRAILQRLTDTAVEAGNDILVRLNGSPEVRRAALLESVPEMVGYYSDGSAALAADSYDEARELAGVASRYTADAVVLDRTVKLRRAIAWAAAPLLIDPDDVFATGKRLAEVISLDVARPFRDTITVNRRQDPASVGWKRITNKCCGFCRMLADRGAVYRESTARFAAHPHCDCSAAPVFTTGETGPEASAIQYMASKRKRTPAEKAELRDFLSLYYSD